MDRKKSHQKALFPQLHKVQWMILHSMKRREFSRFNQIKPKDMDPRRFVYHLNKLKKLGLVKCDDKTSRYFMTEKAKVLINFFPRMPYFEDLPIDSFILLYIKREEKLLVVKRRYAPYLGNVGIPCFNSEQDKYLHETAQQGLESLGLSGKLELPLLIEVIYKGRETCVVKHACMFTFYIENPRGSVKRECEEGTLFWTKPKELLKVEKGYDNSKDLIDFFEKERELEDGITIISRSYDTPM